MKTPQRYSRFAGKAWMRMDWGDGTTRLLRPLDLARATLPSNVNPVAEVVAGAQDTLWSLAAYYYRSLDRPEQLWWLIAEVNGIVDPTLEITGMRIIIPPLSVLEQ